MGSKKRCEKERSYLLFKPSRLLEQSTPHAVNCSRGGNRELNPSTLFISEAILVRQLLGQPNGESGPFITSLKLDACVLCLSTKAL